MQINAGASTKQLWWEVEFEQGVDVLILIVWYLILFDV